MGKLLESTKDLSKISGYKISNKNHLCSGNSLMIQWLGLSAFTAVATVQFLARKLRFCNP